MKPAWPCALALLAGCELKDPPLAERPTRPLDTAVAIAVPGGPVGAIEPTTSASGPQSPPAAPRAMDALATDSFVASEVLPPPARDGALQATPSELLELRLGIVVPVRGVAAGSLRDMYAEARGTRVHEALDILAPRGTPVVSATAGRVLKLHQSRAGGTMIYAADASDRFILLYAHLDTYAPGLAAGQPLTAGQQIGSVGTTGNAPPGTPHLHFAVLRGRPSEAWWRGEPVNPYPLFQP